MIAAQRRAVADEALTWLQTPYHHNARVRGSGADCAQFPAAVYEAAGVIAHVEPEYPSDWHLHRNEEVYLKWAETLGATEIPIERAGPGDFIIWRFGRTFSHGAIFIDPPLIIHASAQAQMVTLDRWDADEELSHREFKVFTFWPEEG